MRPQIYLNKNNQEEHKNSMAQIYVKFVTTIRIFSELL